MHKIKIYKDKRGNFETDFKQKCIEFQNLNQSLKPIGDLTFTFVTKQKKPWLMHYKWTPRSKDNPSILYTSAEHVFKKNIWYVIDRAIDLRLIKYWKEDRAGSLKDFIEWKKLECEKLDHIIIKFETK
jgi:hypothetical protein